MYFLFFFFFFFFLLQSLGYPHCPYFLTTHAPVKRFHSHLLWSCSPAHAKDCHVSKPYLSVPSFSSNSLRHFNDSTIIYWVPARCQVLDTTDHFSFSTLSLSFIFQLLPLCYILHLHHLPIFCPLPTPPALTFPGPCLLPGIRTIAFSRGSVLGFPLPLASLPWRLPWRILFP